MINEDREREWKETHQPYELAYHRDIGIGWCSDDARFWAFWNPILAWAELDKRMEQKVLLDIGCGPRPPFEIFQPYNEVNVIEPLADEYKKLAPEEWWDATHAYSQPGEKLLYDVIGLCDVVMCWNCLDHTADWKKILDNVVQYLKPGAKFILALDTKNPHIGHPSMEYADLMAEIKKRFTIAKEDHDLFERQHLFILNKI